MLAQTTETHKQKFLEDKSDKRMFWKYPKKQDMKEQLRQEEFHN